MPTEINPECLQAARTQFRSAVQALANESKELDAKVIRERLYKMIQYAIDRHDWYETQRHRFLQLSVGLIGFAATLAPVLASLAPNLSILIIAPAGISLAWIAITSFRIVLIYSWLIGPSYPYRKLADIRSWIFRYNFSDDSSVPWLEQDEKLAIKQIKETSDAFKQFQSRWMQFAREPNRFLSEDLEQVFILQLLQKYRAENLKKMTNVVIHGAYVSIFLFVVSLFIYGIFVWNEAASESTLLIQSHPEAPKWRL